MDVYPDEFREADIRQALEIRPGNRKLVHHVLAYYRAKPDAQQYRCCCLIPSVSDRLLHVRQDFDRAERIRLRPG